mmetsp:Transcript_29428/g.62651  ORF Transcript_29428/g.62651 Transcript_29428/m.62651 type:complete len:345 (+) Transcript_29428:38-1072(+)
MIVPQCRVAAFAIIFASAISFVPAIQVASSTGYQGHGPTLVRQASGLDAIQLSLNEGCFVRDDQDHLGRTLPPGALFSNGNTQQLSSAREGEDRKQILWIHLHNFGGTFLCEEALKQGEIGPPNAYSNWPGCLMPGDGCSTQTGRSSCKERARSPYTFTMLERDVDNADFCSEVIMGTTLRDPVDGIVSTLLANQFDKAEVIRMLQRGDAHAAAEHRPCLPSWDTYQHFDNFATRSLGGGYRALPGHVSRSHLEVAKARLRSMDVVLILEDLHQHLPQLSVVLGWNMSSIDTQRPSHGHSCSKKEDVLTEWERDFFTSVNALDYELFTYGKELAANLTRSTFSS